jgi:hypothetical protein
MPDAGEADRLVAAFAAWAAANSVERAAASRSRSRRLKEQAAAQTSLLALALDMAERQVQVVLRAGTWQATAQICAVATDFLLLERPSGPAMVPVSALGSLSVAGGGAQISANEAAPTLALSFAAAVSLLAEEKTPVRVSVQGRLVEGEVASVGSDVVCLRSPRSRLDATWLPLRAIEACEIR